MVRIVFCVWDVSSN